MGHHGSYMMLEWVIGSWVTVSDPLPALDGAESLRQRYARTQRRDDIRRGTCNQ